MNERILELANKANENIGYTFKLEDAKQIHELMEKFAELMVIECAKYVKNTNCFTYASQADLCAERMKQHFGVK